MMATSKEEACMIARIFNSMNEEKDLIVLRKKQDFIFKEVPKRQTILSGRLRKKRLTEEEVQEFFPLAMKDIFKKGKSRKETAKKFGVSYPCMCSWCRLYQRGEKPKAKVDLHLASFEEKKNEIIEIFKRQKKGMRKREIIKDMDMNPKRYKVIIQATSTFHDIPEYLQILKEWK